ncbi:MAG: RNA methyltransferase [Planctomycetota bacterium]|nr:MAG: RNA methyltransferase [Planctomycetota bacterium]REJ88314.1 MAG: RNA methyltransferase [Planctomycetota bacterium]REK22963.1 MAG: RNA methyltransferase [Planctomycetota bacterium]REK44765.1 MAG: RNA methyltransferase [Planctomycetota bacterium]
MSVIDLTSARNDRVKAASQLRRRKHRKQQDRTLIDGVREIATALDAGVEIDEVFLFPPLCRTDAATELLERLEQLPAIRYRVTRPLFEKLAFGERTEGVLAVARTPQRSLDAIELPERPLVLVLEAVEKPGNLGAVLRSAEATGCAAVVLADGQTDLYNPAAIRASLGAVFCLAVAEATSEEVLDWLREQSLQIFAARVDGSVPYTGIDFTGPAAIVLGSEEAGLTSKWMADDVTPIHLPMRGRVDSLNVSTTAAVLAYEAQRQRAASR